MRRVAFSYLLLLIVVLRGVSCLHTELFHKFPELVHKYQYSLHARNDPIEEHTIVQPLDHFEASRSQATFKQRYWVNANYWKNADGPVFLYIGGEFSMSGEYIDYGMKRIIFHLDAFGLLHPCDGHESRGGSAFLKT